MNNSRFSPTRIIPVVLGMLGAVGLIVFLDQHEVIAAGAEGVTGLPADVTPLLSIAGVWQPIADQYITEENPGTLGNTFVGNIKLADGREGLVLNGWYYNGFSTTATSVTPVNMALLEQLPDGTLRLATSKYISDPQTHGSGSVVIADFNRDGLQDIFLAAHNESPALPASSTAYLSNANGSYSKVTVADLVEAHDGNLAYINGTPTVLTGSYYVTQPPNGHADTAIQFDSVKGFTVVQDIGTSGSSVAVADFYGDGTYSAVFGDSIYGPNYPFVPNFIDEINLWRFTDLILTGNPVNVGNPYFNTAAYASYQSFQDPHGKQHNYRVRTEDLNHDGMLDVVVQGSIWHPTVGTQRTILQIFQNNGNYRFTDVTDSLNPQFDKGAGEADYVPQWRDIDASGINSFLSAALSYNIAQPAGNYVIVNDGSGNLQIALHETLNLYGGQIMKWLSDNHPPQWSTVVDSELPRLKAYQTPDGRLNFLAVVDGFALGRAGQHQYILVNVPLQLDITSQFTKPITVKDRNGSHLIRTFAGDDTIYSGHSGGYSKIDGGLGTNSVVYAGRSQNYSASTNSDGSWTIKDNVGTDGTDTLTRVQRLQFNDITIRLDTPNVAGPAASVSVIKGDSQSATVGAAYATELQVAVRDFLGNSVPRVAVTFTAPGSGPGGTFAGGATTATAVTDSSGIAIAPIFTANSVAGAVSVLATVPGVTSPAVFNLTNTPRPGTITSVSMASGGPDIAQNGWIAIKGTNLAPAITPASGVIWNTASEFASGRMPTQLGGVSVTVNAKPAFIYYYCSAATSPSCASDQVNVLTPLDETLGPVQVVVSNSGISTPPFTVNLSSAAPAVPLVGATNYIVATHADNSLVGPVSLSSPGYPLTPAKSGETIVVYAFGLGLPTTPLANGAANQSGVLPAAPKILIGGETAQVIFAGLISPGLYQLNVVVPGALISGDNSFTITYNGSSSPAGDVVSIQ
ncbi:MAG TPA: hypothetical protein VG675_03500 [Bryobacteraceae bacterium]|nr:hypothetical protein [Bryobacteraceae bacterium]